MKVFLGKYKLEYFKFIVCICGILFTSGSDEVMLMVIVFILLCIFFFFVTFNMKVWLRNEVICMSKGYVEAYYFLVKSLKIELSRRRTLN
jgi:predicted membrane metal-binding protein